MAVLDFLFEGKPPKSVTTYGQTVKDVPKWMSDYTQGLIARANAVAGEGYIPYGGPRIAGFDPDQLAAFELTRQNVGSYSPLLEASVAGTAAAGMVSPLGEAQPYLDPAAGRFTGTTVEDYLDPYIENTLARQEELATRTLEEKFLPGLQRAFIGAGQFGSKGRESMEELGLRGVRDISEQLEGQRAATMSDAYARAQAAFQADQQRLAQLGEISGRLGLAGGELGLAGARQLGALGEAAQQLGLRDAAALEAIGATQRQLPQSSLDLAYEDFVRQRDFPRSQVEFLSQIIRGLPSHAVPSSATETRVGPAETYQPSPLAQIASAYGTYRGLTGNKRGGLIEAYEEMDTDPEFLMRKVA